MSETWMGLVIGCSALVIALPAVMGHYRRERHRARLLRHLDPGSRSHRGPDVEWYLSQKWSGASRTDGDPVAAMSLVGQPEYWRRRVGMLLVSAGVFTAEREFAQALLRRLARIPQWQGASDSQRPCANEVGPLAAGLKMDQVSARSER